MVWDPWGTNAVQVISYNATAECQAICLIEAESWRMAKQKKSTTLFFDGRKYSKIYVLEWQYQIQSIYFKNFKSME